MTGSSLLLTVCVPSYNYAAFLPGCLESVLDQSFRDFELVVVDDASGDDSVEIVQKYRDPRLSFHRHGQNAGAIATWNECLTLARGEYVSYLCADDLFMPGKLECQLAAIEAHPKVGLVHADGDFVGEEGARQVVFHSVFPPELQAYLQGDHVAPAPSELPRLAAGYNYIHLSSALFRRSAALDLGGFSEAFPYAADWDLWLRLAARHDVGYVARPLSAFRRHRRNLTLTMQSSGQEFRDWYGVTERAFSAWPAHAGPVGPVRASARRVIREHLLARVHLSYARGDARAARRDLWLGFRRDPRLLLDGLTVATFVKSWLDVPRWRGRLHHRKDRHACG